jgi:hypothetical protein
LVVVVSGWRDGDKRKIEIVNKGREQNGGEETSRAGGTRVYRRVNEGENQKINFSTRGKREVRT